MFVFFDTDLVTPDGGIIPKNTNLASLFNVAGLMILQVQALLFGRAGVLESLPPCKEIYDHSGSSGQPCRLGLIGDS